jgi:hypothetical protein
MRGGAGFYAQLYLDFRDTDKQNRRNMFLSLLTQRSAWSVDILFRLFPNLVVARSSDGVLT